MGLTATGQERGDSVSMCEIIRTNDMRDALRQIF